MRFLGTLFVACLLFLSGFGVGSGQIMFSKDKVFKQPTEQNSKLSEDLDYATVEQVYDVLRAHYDGELTTEKLLDGLKDGLASSTGDPYTQFLNKEEAEEFSNDLSGTFVGIGAQLIELDNLITVEVPLAGYPAEKAGLKAKDVIIQIDDEDATQMSVSEAVKLIRGKEGTDVTLKVIRDKKEEHEFTITRTKITIPSVKSEILEGNIGYLQIARFGPDTTKLAREAAQSFKDAGVEGVILDLRNDPGGLLDSAVEVSGLWLDPGKTILKEKRGGVVVKTLNAKGTQTLKGIPTIVLINGGSASASEITAGALRDHGVAKLFGEQSYGKGSVQSLENFNDGSVLKVTIARWFTPNDVNIDKEGIKPDTTIELTEENTKDGADPQRAAALEALQK